MKSGIHESEEQRAQEERLKSQREAWDILQGQKVAIIRATERDLRVLNEERQAKLDELERINVKLRQSERRGERMRLEEEKEENQAELERRAYNEVQRLEEQRREHAQHWALKRRQADQNQELPLTNFQRAYAPLIAVLNAALTMNQAPVRGPLPSTWAPQPLR